MRKILRVLLLALIIIGILAQTAQGADTLRFSTAPNVLRPGKYYDIAVAAPADGSATLSLHREDGELVYTVLSDYPLVKGENKLAWDGMRLDHSLIDQGEYVLRLAMASTGEQIESPLRIGAAYPFISDVFQSVDTVHEDSALDVSFNVSDAGMMLVQLQDSATKATRELTTLEVLQGGNVFHWEPYLLDVPLSPGAYALIMTLQTTSGAQSMPQYVFLTIADDEEEAEALPEETAIIVDATPPAQETPAAGDGASGPTETPAGTLIMTTLAEDEAAAPAAELVSQTPGITPPYSDVDDGTFWAMNPGELDDAVIWDILTQPITVYDDGKIGDRDHVYLMANPDGTGAKVAQIHGKSQGLHVIGQENEYGYVLVEAFSNYDPEYQPTTDEERAQAFDLKHGFIKASGLKTVEVNQEIAILIDKLTQRLYVFKNGERITELLIATGKIAEEKYYNETIAGEYITISHTGGFWSGNMYCDMAIRINGGILLHEVPHKVNADGTKNYSSFEAYLGTKQSHGCIRIQRLKNDEGYNHAWLWNTLERKGGHKVIIWDDLLPRLDSPTTWQENPS